MARKRKVTPEVIESMKMLHDQGVTVSMIADVLKFSKWTEVKDTSVLLSSNIPLNGESSALPTESLTAYKLTSIAGGIVEINRTLGQLVSIFQHIDDELTGEVKASPDGDESLTI